MRITCVHQGFELYGSDRSFIESVTMIREVFPDADIEVVLPRHGPIVPLLSAASRVTIEPLWVLRRKNLAHLATVGLARLPSAILRAHVRLRHSDIVYINTCVLADYLIASALGPRRSIVHAHEIAGGLTRQLLRALVRFSGGRVIFNSRATREAFALPEGRDTRVIYNGIAGPAAIEPKTYDGTRPLRLLMLGRYSRIKGQEVLVEALSMLPAGLRPETRIVGGAFEDAERERNLAALITRAGLDNHARLMPFTPDPAWLYRWADVVVVPSRLPESLGRVAIEAMAHGRPPLVSAIGGLPEVVVDGETGWLVAPDSPAALADALRAVIEQPHAWDRFPAAARARYEALFSEAAFAADMKRALLDAAGARPATPARDRRDPALPGKAA